MGKNRENIKAIFQTIPELAMASFGFVGKIIETTFKWDTIKGLFGAMFTGMINQFSIAWKIFPKIAMEAINIVITPLAAVGEFLLSVFANTFGKIRNVGVDALQALVSPINAVIEGLNNIPGIDNELINFDFLKEEVPKIEEFSDVWDRKMEDAGNSITKITKIATEAVIETGKNSAKVFGDIGELYNEDYKKYEENTRKIIETQKEKNKQLVESEKEAQEEIQENQEESAEKQKAIFAEMIEYFKSKINEYVAYADTILAGLSGIFDSYYNNQEIQIENDYKKKRKYIEKNITDEKEKKKALKKLDKKHEKEVRELKTKQARATKTFAIFQSIIDGARAIIKALADGGPILAGIVGGMAAIQTGIIASQPIPKFAQGGVFETEGPQIIQVGDNIGGKERVTVEPISSGSSNNQPIQVFVYLGGELIYDRLHQATKDRRLLIDAGAIV